MFTVKSGMCDLYMSRFRAIPESEVTSTMEAAVAGVNEKRTSDNSPLQVEESAPVDNGPKRQRMATTPSCAESAQKAATQWKSPQEIKEIMEAVDKRVVHDHFRQDDKAGSQVAEDEDNEVHNGCKPFLVADGVSKDAFHVYYEDCGYGEEAPITLRFLEFSKDGRLWIVDWPTKVHEVTTGLFDSAFSRVWWLKRAFREDSLTSMGHTTVNGKEADATYGPRRGVPRPHVLGDEIWITFVVEVGISQSWQSLEAKALQWYEHPAIQYILLMQVSPQGRHLKYALYDVPANPLDAQRPDTLPEPTAFKGSIHFVENGGAPEILSLDNRRILGFAIGQPLPPNVADNSDVDLRFVLNEINANL